MVTQEHIHVIKRIDEHDTNYPVTVKKYNNNNSFDAFFALGNISILNSKSLALFCSVKCPGNVILKTFDLVRTLRDEGVIVISGFHSPMEQECLDILLRGKQPVVISPARRIIDTHLPKKYISPMQNGRLLLLSPFDARVKRVIKDAARIRNEFVAALADRVFVAYAAPGSKTEDLCKQIINWGKPLITFDVPENRGLIAMGAQPFNQAVL